MRPMAFDAAARLEGSCRFSSRRGRRPCSRCGSPSRAPRSALRRRPRRP